ncbi:MAG: cobyric acid synthase [Desulfovibrio sp.]|jgi:adenosylcobyric acid synthase|nr:cobyric acid synthase [Desulfovibrio sp.]
MLRGRAKQAGKLMVQGTASSVGKSLLVTALCRIFALRGIKVAPFKAQNMSLNSFITSQGHEIGRAQAVQAEAAGIDPSCLMNPVLLKPTDECRSQVIVNGVVYATLSAREYYRKKPELAQEVANAFKTLAKSYELVIIEGAGSPAEINLRAHDLANMGLAEMIDAPVLLLGDIERGGVFASLFGTFKLLKRREQRRIKGFIINKFRGDPDILTPGIAEMELLIGRGCLGVLPWFTPEIDEEDSLSERLRPSAPRKGGEPELDVAVIRLPFLSNYTDFSVFDLFPEVELRYADQPETIGKPDLLILPGSKNTLNDLEFLRSSGLFGHITRLRGAGVPIIGLCGGFQMLGRLVRDPLGVESGLGEAAGFGFLDMETIFEEGKRATQTRVRIGETAARAGLARGAKGLELSGYEIHMGRSFSRQGALPPFAMDAQGSGEGAVNGDGTVIGSYLHGFFDNVDFTSILLNNLRRAKGLAPKAAPALSYADFRRGAYDRLARTVETSLDMEAIDRIIADRR